MKTISANNNVNWTFPASFEENDAAEMQYSAWLSLINEKSSFNDKILSKLNISMPDDPKTPSINEKILLLNNFPPSNIFLIKFQQTENDSINTFDILKYFFQKHQNHPEILSASILADKPNEIIIEASPNLSDIVKLFKHFDYLVRKQQLTFTISTTDSFAQHFASFFFCSRVISSTETFCCRIFDPHLPFYYKNDVVEVIDANLQIGKAIIRLWPRLTYGHERNDQMIPISAPFDSSRIPPNTKKKTVAINYNNERVSCFVYKDMKFNGHFLIMQTKISNLKSWSVFIPNEEKLKFEEVFDESDSEEENDNTKSIPDDSSSTTSDEESITSSNDNPPDKNNLKRSLRNQKKNEQQTNEAKKKNIDSDSYYSSYEYSSNYSSSNSSDEAPAKDHSDDNDNKKEASAPAKKRGRPPKNNNITLPPQSTNTSKLLQRASSSPIHKPNEILSKLNQNDQKENKQIQEKTKQVTSTTDEIADNTATKPTKQPIIEGKTITKYKGITITKLEDTEPILKISTPVEIQQSSTSNISTNDSSSFDEQYQNEFTSAPIDDPIKSPEKPSQPEQKPIQTEQKTTQPKQKPIQPEQKPIQPEQKPIQLEQKPIQLEQKPIQLEQKPIQPEQTLIQPEQKPIQFEPKPTPIYQPKPLYPEMYSPSKTSDIERAGLITAITSLSNEISEKIKENQALLLLKHSIEEENQQLKEENIKLKEQNKDNANNEAMKKMIEQLQENNKKLKDQVSNYQKNYVPQEELKKLKDENKKYKDSIDNYQKNYVPQEELKKIKDENKKLKDENTKYQKNYISQDEYTKIKDENKKLKDDITKYSQDAKTWEKRAKEMLKENEDLKRSVEIDRKKNKIEFETEKTEEQTIPSFSPKKFNPGDSVLYKKPLSSVYCHVLSSSPGFVKIIPVPRALEVPPNDIIHKQIPFFKDVDPYINRPKLSSSEPIVTCNVVERPYINQYMLINAAPYGVGIVLDMKDAIIEFLTTDNQLHKISVENPFTKVKKTKFALDSDSNRISYSDEVFYEDMSYTVIATFYDMVFIANKNKKEWAISKKTTMRKQIGGQYMMSFPPENQQLPFPPPPPPLPPPLPPAPPAPPFQHQDYIPPEQQNPQPRPSVARSPSQDIEPKPHRKPLILYKRKNDDIRNSASTTHAQSPDDSPKSTQLSFERQNSFPIIGDLDSSSQHFEEKPRPSRDYRKRPPVQRPPPKDEHSEDDNEPPEPKKFGYQDASSLPKTEFGARKPPPYKKRGPPFERGQRPPPYDYRDTPRRPFDRPYPKDRHPPNRHPSYK